MQEEQISGNRQKRWRRIADTVLLLNWRKLLLIFVIWALTALLIWAIYGPFAGFFGASDGLAGSGVTDIIRDDNGDLLIATWGGGVSRYDGRSWQTLTTRDGLADDRVNALAQTGAGDIWFGTYAGLSRYDGVRWRSFSTEDGLPDDNAMALAVDAGDNVWVGTAKGLSHYDVTSGELLPLPIDELQPLVSAIHADNLDRIWVGTTDSGLYRYDDTGWHKITAAGALAQHRVEAIYQDRQGDVWVGARGGLNRYDGRSWHTYTTADGLPEDIILALAEDATGYLLAGTTDGLSRFDGQAWQPVAPVDGPATEDIQAIFVDQDGTLWVGGDGLRHFDGDNWQTYRFQAGLLPTLIFVLGTVVIPIYLVLALAYTIIRTQPRSRYLLLNRYTLLTIPAFFLGILLHNVVYAMFYPYFMREGGDEGVFFVVALIGIPLYFLLVLLNTIVKFISGRRAGGEEGHILAGGSGSAG